MVKQSGNQKFNDKRTKLNYENADRERKQETLKNIEKSFDLVECDKNKIQ